MDNQFIQAMYRQPEPEPPDETGRIEEHNRIVKSFEGAQGQADARAAFDFWYAEYNRLHTFDSHRMLQIAGGLAGVQEPWMRDVGHLTGQDREHLLQFRSKEKADPKLEDLRTKIWERQQNEARALADKQSAEQSRLGLSQPLLDQHRIERERQTTAFADDRARRIREYNESKRLAAELDQEEKQKTAEPGRELS